MNTAAARRELVAAQGAEESQRPPVATRHQAPHPITLGPHPRSGAMLVRMWITRDWICRMWSTEREGCRGGFGGLKEPAEYNGDWNV